MPKGEFCCRLKKKNRAGICGRVARVRCSRAPPSPCVAGPHCQSLPLTTIDASDQSYQPTQPVATDHLEPLSRPDQSLPTIWDLPADPTSRNRPSGPSQPTRPVATDRLLPQYILPDRHHDNIHHQPPYQFGSNPNCQPIPGTNQSLAPNQSVVTRGVHGLLPNHI